MRWSKGVGECGAGYGGSSGRSTWPLIAGSCILSVQFIKKLFIVERNWFWKSCDCLAVWQGFRVIRLRTWSCRWRRSWSWSWRTPTTRWRDSNTLPQCVPLVILSPSSICTICSLISCHTHSGQAAWSACVQLIWNLKCRRHRCGSLAHCQLWKSAWRAGVE